MPAFSPGEIIFLVAVAAFTLTAAYFDTFSRRIPNWLTVSFFALGLIYQPVFHGWSGLGNGLAGFAIGFGLFFLIWLIGSGGGGDVKLMGALSVWLGWKQTLLVIALVVPLVVFLSIVFAVARKMKTGVARQYSDADFEETPKQAKKRGRPKRAREEKIKELQQRRLMAFALPVAIATWLVVFLNMWQYLPDKYR